jgi:hypothetical protein
MILWPPVQSVDVHNKIQNTRYESDDSDVKDELDTYFDESDEEEMTYANLHINDVSHIIDSLLRLGVAMRSPAPYDMFRSSAGQYHHLDAKHIRDKFPAITDRGKTLIERLARAITYRRQYFHYRKDHHAKLAAGTEQSQHEWNWPEHGTAMASEIPKKMQDREQSEGVFQGAPLQIDSISFDDDKSDESISGYESSTKGDSLLRIPKMPKSAKNEPFLCPYCYRMTKAMVPATWK